MKLQNSLRPASYQLVPLLKLLHNKLNVILISDGVGVGKTISAGYILLFLISKYSQPGLVVCPPSLLLKWKEEIETKFGMRTFTVTGKEEFATMEEEILANVKRRVGTVYILPSSILDRFKLSKNTRFSVIVFDEIHNFRNKDTYGFVAAKKVAAHSTYKVGLTATPINNSLEDLVSILSILLADSSWEAVSIMLDDLWAHQKEFITNGLVTRFTKENLGIHFAKRQIKSFDVSYPVDYVNKVNNIISKIPSTRDTFFEKVTYYRLAASSANAFSASVGLSEKLIDPDPKVEKLKAIIKKIKQNKWIIFCEFTETVNTLEKELSSDWEVFTMTGDTPIFSRQDTIEDFRKSKKSILVMTQVGSEGLDMQFCSAVVNYDLHWNPMKIEQRIGRVDRVGQKKDKITVVNLIVHGSVDERILQVIENKLEIIAKSVFDLGSTIHQKRDKKIQMFDTKILKTETESSKKFFKSMENWTTLPIEDYSILPKIDKKFCGMELKKIPKTKTRKLFKNSNEFEKWKKKTQEYSNPVRQRLNLYS